MFGITPADKVILISDNREDINSIYFFHEKEVFCI